MKSPATSMLPYRVWAAWALISLLLLFALGGLLLWMITGTPWPEHTVASKLWWQQQLEAWEASYHAAPLVFAAVFMLVFTVLSALALPGCAPLALLAGSTFGTLSGTLVVGVASTLGALLSFLFARHLARERVQRWLGARGQGIDRLLLRRSALWLFWLRLVPLVPYPVINPLLGLSRLGTARFFWPSLAGLTLGSVPYVWAGRSLHDWFVHGQAALPLAAAALLVLAACWLLARRFAQRLAADGAAPSSSA